MRQWWQYLGMDSWSWWTRWRLQCPAPRIRRGAPSPSSWTRSLSGSWRCWGWCSSWSAWCSRCSQGLGEITWHNPSHSNLTIFISEPSFQRTDLFLTLPMHDWWTRHCWKVKNIWERITTLFKVSSSLCLFCLVLYFIFWIRFEIFSFPRVGKFQILSFINVINFPLHHKLKMT